MRLLAELAQQAILHEAVALHRVEIDRTVGFKGELDRRGERAS
jgi:hypothetical protein